MLVVLGELELVLGDDVGVFVEDDEADGTEEATSEWHRALCGLGYALTWCRNQESQRILRLSTWW
jgi:hypothetical protein